MKKNPKTEMAEHSKDKGTAAKNDQLFYNLLIMNLEPISLY